MGIKYEYLPHTADMMIRAYGKRLEEAFGNCAYATFALIIEPKNVKPNLRKDFEIKSNRIESLLYDFIDELLFVMDSESFLLSKIETIKISKHDEKVGTQMISRYKLRCVMHGDNSRNYETKGDIKAMTYSHMEIKEEDGFVITFVVDI